MRPSNDNPVDFLERIVPFVQRDGARNLNQISRELHIPYQTLRFRMMNLGQLGMNVQAIPDLQKIGLETVRVGFKLPPGIKNARAFLEEMHRSSGLRSYARLMFSRTFDCEFSVPIGSVPELQRLFLKLEKLGLVQSVEIKRILWKDRLALRPEFYDYSLKDWGFDLQNLLSKERENSIQTPKRENVSHFDYIDLLMLKEFELNAWIKTVELAKKTSLPVGDAAYHVNRHVFDRKLIKEFKLCWAGSRGEGSNRSGIVKTFVISELSDEDKNVKSLFASIPFARSHMQAEDGTYYAEVDFPVGWYLEASRLISSRLGAMDLNPTVLERDWSFSVSFTTPVALFDKDQGAWNFKTEDAVERLIQITKAKVG